MGVNMHKVCKSECGGNLEKIFDDEHEFGFRCNKCGRVVTQRKRKPGIKSSKKDVQLLCDYIRENIADLMHLNNRAIINYVTEKYQ